MYVLDTDICSYAMRGKPKQVAEKMQFFDWGELAVSAIVQYELESGARRSPNATTLLAIIGSFLVRVQVMPFDSAAAREASGVRAAMAAAGTPIGYYDTLIAGHALALDATLVTNNVDEFDRVEGLRIENWAA